MLIHSASNLRRILTSSLLLSPTYSYCAAFAATSSSSTFSSKALFSPSELKMSSKSEFDISKVDFPNAISVSPGTSPVEEQPKLNPIDSTCTVLIVGATRGIGLEFVKQCLSKGATVIGTHRSEEMPPELQSLQAEFPKTLIGLQMDISSEESIQDATMAFKAKDIGALTHIIHNAGIYLPETSFDGEPRGPRPAAPVVTKEALLKTFEINTIAPLLVAQHFVPLTGKRNKLLYPIIAFMSSKVGSVDDNGSGGAYAYRSSKSALNNIAKSISNDLADEIRVVLLHPGYVRTDMTSGKGFIDVDESASGLLNAIEATDANTSFRFVDFKANLIPW